MAKRFTDTDKWKRPWFRKLPSEAKLAWIYLLDECDHAGVWIADLSLMSFQLNLDVSLSDLKRWFGEKIELVDHDKVFIRSFIEFQYGELRDGNAVHRSVISRLAKAGVDIAHESGLSNDPGAVLARLSAKKKRQVMTDDFFVCTYCGIGGNEQTLTVDHIVPRTKGGDNSDVNLTTACLSCNSRKSDIDANEFIEHHGLRDRLSIRLLDKLSLIGAIKPLNTVIKDLSGAKDKDKDKDKDQDKNTDTKKFQKSSVQKFDSVYKYDLQSLFDLYPRQEKKAQAIQIMAERIQSQSDRDEWERAIRNYATQCRNEERELKYILTFPNFLDEWTDWRDRQPLKSVANSDIVER